jgi:hypothetical protein
MEIHNRKAMTMNGMSMMIERYGNYIVFYIIYVGYCEISPLGCDKAVNNISRSLPRIYLFRFPSCSQVARVDIG